MVEEARLEDGPSGLAPASEGWFVVNVHDTAWFTHETFGSACRFEGQQARFTDIGINLRVLRRHEPACLYHSESVPEDFLVLAGECLLLVDGEERRLRAWDFVHCPAGTEHVFVGAGDGPCVVLMVGARSPDSTLNYPAAEVALRHGAGAETETASPAEAYSRFSRPEPRRPEGWDRLPWARGR